MDYGGMTVNERLYESGKLDKFDKAVAQKNVKEVVKILKAVDLKTESIIPILESLGFEKDDAEL
ncbi:hypothetical protein ACSV4D_18050 [Flavobacterium sp. ARAG 55.4]|uniref:hypothetical protein n=1 Tax=Flavobacterium sp. ARAG 55.4 TaxID=3451357 RepID=UPI003F45036C